MQRTTTLDELKACEQPLVLVFPTARPDTVNYFELASAVVFGAGGALCHACTIAREQNLTCVTALGGAFIKAMEEAKQRDLWLNVNGASGEVGFV